MADKSGIYGNRMPQNLPCSLQTLAVVLLSDEV
jgi:hypothetical protein